jgi:hypothetical protein
MQVIDKWWPGTESNHRHADFQGVTGFLYNTLIHKAVANCPLLRILVAVEIFRRSILLNQGGFATSDHAGVTP